MKTWIVKPIFIIFYFENPTLANTANSLPLDPLEGRMLTYYNNLVPLMQLKTISCNRFDQGTDINRKYHCVTLQQNDAFFIQTVYNTMRHTTKLLTLCHTNVFLTNQNVTYTTVLNIICRNFAVHKIRFVLWIPSIFSSQAVLFPR